jgi:hypothetical protein
VNFLFVISAISFQISKWTTGFKVLIN